MQLGTIIQWETVLPLSGTSRVADVSNKFQTAQAESTDWSSVVLSIAVPLGVALAILAIYRWRTRPQRDYCRPTKIFSELCRRHKIKGRQQQLLLRMASKIQLDQPALLFTLPQLFESAAGQIETNSEQTNELRTKLFGGNFSEPVV